MEMGVGNAAKIAHKWILEGTHERKEGAKSDLILTSQGSRIKSIWEASSKSENRHSWRTCYTGSYKKNCRGSRKDHECGNGGRVTELTEAKTRYASVHVHVHGTVTANCGWISEHEDRVKGEKNAHRCI
jgi:hypothetical protein